MLLGLVCVLVKEELPVAKDGLPALQDGHPTALVSAIDLVIVRAMHFPTVGLSVMYVMTCILYLLLWKYRFHISFPLYLKFNRLSTMFNSLSTKLNNLLT